ncbi:MAG: acyl-CoA dehydrogenase [Actinobacteria bacterium 13_2_20CM_2_71_6]|nr:MAG: acyl-CoA dehydrogenase [Actinobacteria bacterium 13_2_20CM_2_71_6]
MIELDDRLLALRAHAHGWSADLRDMAMDVDRDPDAVQRFADRDVLRFLATFRRSGDPVGQPLIVDGRRCLARTVLEQVVLMEELAYGDLGALLAAPGAPMAGPLVELLGDAAQQEWFFGRMNGPARWAFFALTEPDRGSDAVHLGTTLTPDGDGFVLTGAKRYVGNAARSQLGVVFARLGSGPLGVRAVLVEASDPGLTMTTLPTVGLRGAALSAITMDSVPLAPQRILGRHLPTARRGAWGWLRVFNLLRPGLAAMAVGVARAASEYVRANRRALTPAEHSRLDAIDRHIDSVRQLTYHAAATVDADPADGSLASAAKARAARLAEDVTLAAPGFFGAGARFEHPLLDKLARDARGLEFMEGTGHVHRLLMSQHVIRGRTDHG